MDAAGVLHQTIHNVRYMCIIVFSNDGVATAKRLCVPVIFIKCIHFSKAVESGCTLVCRLLSYHQFSYSGSCGWAGEGSCTYMAMSKL